MIFTFPIKTVSEANQREHWRVKNTRKKKQQRDFEIIWHSLGVLLIELPATVTFTRYSCRLLDSDNLAGAFKHVRDQFAALQGVDDGDPRITWKYAQERINKREHYFTVEVV